MTLWSKQCPMTPWVGWINFSVVIRAIGSQHFVIELLEIVGTSWPVCVNIFNFYIKIGCQTNVKTVLAKCNGYFDSKVLSRQHAEVWEQDGKVISN